MIILDWFLGKLPFGAKRSALWLAVREKYLWEHPTCECCEGRKNLEVHHIKPVHLFPELELMMSNLVTLCERMKCHFAFGHLYSWRSYNPNIKEDLKMWNEKVRSRP